MKKLNKKGFTIVELVIVIAVIAILAGVMIPTFGSVIEKANQSKAYQQVAAGYKEAYALAISDGKVDSADEYTCNGVKFTFTDDGGCTIANGPTGYNCTVTSGVLKVEKAS